MTNPVKPDLQKLLQAQTKELKGYLDKKLTFLDKKLLQLEKKIEKQNNELALLVARGFQTEREYWNTKLSDIYPKLKNFESRINRVEQAVGIVVN